MHQRWWHAALHALVLILAAIALLEWLLGTCGVGQQEFAQPDAELGRRHIPGKLVTWRLEGYSSDHLNSAGLRDVEHKLEKLPGVTRIALLGDSSTEGMQVPLAKTYARVLNSALDAEHPGKFEVINFGCSGYSTGQELIQLEKDVVGYAPDITVLLYNRGDALENVRNPLKKNVEPRPYFYLDEDGRLREDATLLAQRQQGLLPEQLWAFLREHSHIFGVFSQTDLSLSIHERLYRKLRSWVLRLASLLAPRSGATGAVAAYRPQDGWQVTCALIEAMNQECRKHHSRFVLLCFPNLLGDPELSRQRADLEVRSRNRRFAFLDLTPGFANHPDPGSLFLQYHFSTAGHHLVAEQLRQLLAAEHLI